MKRVKAIISYDGSRFYGFQYQKDKNSVANSIYKALNSLKIDTKIVASGRTDRGVHATNQVLHFDIPNYWKDLEKLKNHLNYRLYPSIKFKKIYFKKDNFHARFDAKRRAYRYILSNKDYNPFEAFYVTFIKDIDFNSIKNAIKIFEGEHDFRYFQKSGSDVKTTVRYIYKTKIYFYKDYTILYFEANGFLRSQVRMMVDFLLKIGKKELDINQLKEQIDCKKRYSSSLAEPNGLYLAKVIY